MLLGTPAAWLDPGTLDADRTWRWCRIAWSGGNITSNKEEALHRFLQRKAVRTITHALRRRPRPLRWQLGRHHSISDVQAGGMCVSRRRKVNSSIRSWSGASYEPPVLLCDQSSTRANVFLTVRIHGL
jgi:hypothetical protein